MGIINVYMYFFFVAQESGTMDRKLAYCFIL